MYFYFSHDKFMILFIIFFQGMHTRTYQSRKTIIILEVIDLPFVDTIPSATTTSCANKNQTPEITH